MTHRAQLTPREERDIAKRIVEACKVDPDGWRFDAPYATYREDLRVWFRRGAGPVRLAIEHPVETRPFRLRTARKAVKALHRLRHAKLETRHGRIVAALETPKPEPIDITPTVQVAEPKRVPLAA